MSVRGLIVRAVAVAEALKPAVGALDLAGLSWRRLRAFQRGAGCLSDCAEGHTYGPWCQLGWPVPGPTYVLHAIGEATMPLPAAPQRLHDETIRAIHEALTQVALVEQAGPHQCFSGCAHWPDGFDGERTRRTERIEQIEQVEPEIAERLRQLLGGPVDTLLHLDGCASVEDEQGKSGPCDCHAEWRCGLCGQGPDHVIEREDGTRVPIFGGSASSGGADTIPLHHDDAERIRLFPEAAHGPTMSCYHAWTVWGARPGLGDWAVNAGSPEPAEGAEP